MWSVPLKLSLLVLFTCMFAAALLLPLAISASSSFPDVESDSPYRVAIENLAERGIILGYTNGNFGPDDLVLRQQFAKMVVLSLGLGAGEEDVCSFGDVEISGPGELYPDNYVAVAAREGITIGTGPTTFSPWDDISRFQVVTMVVRALEGLHPGLLSVPPDDFVCAWHAIASPDHGPNARLAQYNGLLDVLPLSELDPWGAMPRAEVAQVLHNMLVKLTPVTSSTTEPSTTTTTAPAEPTIQDLKGLDWERYVGEEVTVRGVFVNDPLPMLVTDLDVVRVNMPIPDHQYILVRGTPIEDGQMARLGGVEMAISGRVELRYPAEERQTGPTGAVASGREPGDFRYVELANIEYRVINRVAYHSPAIIDVAMVDNLEPRPERFAILFSGGINAANNHVRYWNDLKFMYSTLIGPLAFPKNNIAVLYADGKPQDTSMPVHYSATQANLSTVFDLLRERADEDDLVFVFFTNHGGGFKKTAASNQWLYGGQIDADSDEPNESISEATYGVDLNHNGKKTDFVSWDECLFAWQGNSQTASREILDDPLQAIFGNLTFDRMVILMEQCFGGGLIHDLAQGGERIIISAAGEHESSWAMSSYNSSYDEFSYYFTCAIREADHLGNKVDADANKDGEVSMVEAFNYARSKDTQSETPWYEDSGDGIPHSGAMPAGGDGSLGSLTSLEP